METTNQYIGKKISNKRKLLNMRQEILAAFVGVTRTSIVNIEKGRQSTTFENLVKICSVLKCTPNDLFPEISFIEWKDNIEITEEKVTITVPRIIIKKTIKLK